MKPILRLQRSCLIYVHSETKREGEIHQVVTVLQSQELILYFIRNHFCIFKIRYLKIMILLKPYDADEICLKINIYFSCCFSRRPHRKPFATPFDVATRSLRTTALNVPLLGASEASISYQSSCIPARTATPRDFDQDNTPTQVP